MSKTGNTELFELIRSLTKSEKRHFKIHASRHVIGKENKYVKLFDAIDAQMVYDEKLLLKDQAYIRQLPLLKKRLHSAVLNSLDLFHTSVDAEIRKQLHQAEILYEKALYEQAKKILRSVRKVTDEHEIFTFCLEIIRWETKIAWAQDNMAGLSEFLLREKEVLRKLENANKYRVLNHTVFSIYYEHGIPRTPQLIARVKKVLDDPLLKDLKHAQSFEAEHTFYHFHTVYNSMKQDFEKASSFGLKKLSMFDRDPEKIKTYTNFYLGDLNDCIIFSFMLKEYKNMDAHIGKLRALESASLSERSKTILFFYAYHELNYYNVTRQFQKAAKRIEELEALFLVYGPKLTPAKRAVLYTTFAVACFGNRNFKKSIYFLNQVRNESLGNVRSDIESFAHLFHIIVHFEKGSDVSLLKSLLRSTYRYLLKRNRLYKMEECILNFIRKKLSKVHSQKELLHSFRELKEDITRILKDPFESGIIQDFDFIAWLDGKIQGGK